jgi:hypothetical protein
MTSKDWADEKARAFLIEHASTFDRCYKQIPGTYHSHEPVVEPDCHFPCSCLDAEKLLATALRSAEAQGLEEAAVAVSSRGFYRDECGEKAAETIRSLPAAKKERE